MKTFLSLTRRTFSKDRVRVFFEGTGIEKGESTLSATRSLTECRELVTGICRRAIVALGATIALVNTPVLAQDTPSGEPVTTQGAVPVDRISFDVDKLRAIVVSFVDGNNNTTSMTLGDIFNLTPEKQAEIYKMLPRSGRSSYNMLRLAVADQREVVEMRNLKELREKEQESRGRLAAGVKGLGGAIGGLEQTVGNARVLGISHEDANNSLQKSKSTLADALSALKS